MWAFNLPPFMSIWNENVQMHLIIWKGQVQEPNQISWTQCSLSLESRSSSARFFTEYVVESVCCVRTRGENKKFLKKFGGRSSNRDARTVIQLMNSYFYQRTSKIVLERFFSKMMNKKLKNLVLHLVLHFFLVQLWWLIKNSVYLFN